MHSDGPTDEREEPLDAFLDEAIGGLSGILGQLGYSPPQLDATPLECPSGELLFCDLAALPARRRLGRIEAGGRTRGVALDARVEEWTPVIADSLPGAVCDLLLFERNVPAVRERTLARFFPTSGFFLVGDPTLLAGLLRTPRRAPRADGSGARETATRVAREAGARLGPSATTMLLHAAPTGAWRGVVHGREALVINLGHRRMLRLREGRAAGGERVYLRVDTLRDAVLADPKMRAMAKKEGLR